MSYLSNGQLVLNKLKQLLKTNRQTMKTILAMTASALAVLGYAESSISFAYDKDEVKELWEGLSDQAKEGAEAVLLGYILLAADEEMTPGTIDDSMIPGGVEGEGAEEGEEEVDG